MLSGCHIASSYFARVELAVRTPKSAHRVMEKGKAKIDLRIDELAFLENRVQSEKRSAALPYVPHLTDCISLRNPHRKIVERDAV
jgi:hypothetical protein